MIEKILRKKYGGVIFIVLLSSWNFFSTVLCKEGLLPFFHDNKGLLIYIVIQKIVFILPFLVFFRGYAKSVKESLVCNNKIIVSILLGLYFIISIFLIENLSPIEILLYLSMQLFLVACFEELLFRGILLKAYIEKYNTNRAAIYTSVLFTVAHFANYVINYNISSFLFFSIFCMIISLLFVYIYRLTNSLLIPIVLHAMWNVVSFYATIPIGFILLILVMKAKNKKEC